MTREKRSHNTAGSPLRAPRSSWAWLYWWPIRRADQALFAEALSQALAAGLDVASAVWVAARATPGQRFRAALQEMITHIRSGVTLAESLRRTGVGVTGELLAALAVGEERGDLPGSLSGFARRCGGDPGRRLAIAVGRRPEATHFAAALARLLRDQRLTVGLVEDAARLAAGERSAFADAVGRVAEEMRSGETLSLALSRQRRFFDPFFCALVGAPDGRDQLRTVLIRLGEDPDTEPPAASGAWVAK
jgi:type II secretory pathway component PulF